MKIWIPLFGTFDLKKAFLGYLFIFGNMLKTTATSDYSSCDAHPEACSATTDPVVIGTRMKALLKVYGEDFRWVDCMVGNTPNCIDYIYDKEDYSNSELLTMMAKHTEQNYALKAIIEKDSAYFDRLNKLGQEKRDKDLSELRKMAERGDFEGWRETLKKRSESLRAEKAKYRL